MHLFEGRKTALFLTVLVSAVAGFGVAVEAASYKQLKEKGFKTSKLTKNRAGQSGYYVTDGSAKYFCVLRPGVTIKNSKTLMLFMVSGRTISMNRQAYESKTTLNKNTPKYSDVLAGRVGPQSVRSCRKQ